MHVSAANLQRTCRQLAKMRSNALDRQANRFIALVVGTALVAAVATVPVSHAANVRFCNRLHTDSTVGASCATLDRVSAAYAKRCGSRVNRDPIGCRVRVLSYLCHDTGDAYHPVHCAAAGRRITFQLAE